MVKASDKQIVVYTYDTVSEMMIHINTMNASGYSLVSASSSVLKAKYEKNL